MALLYIGESPGSRVRIQRFKRIRFVIIATLSLGIVINETVSIHAILANHKDFKDISFALLFSAIFAVLYLTYLCAEFFPFPRRTGLIVLILLLGAMAGGIKERVIQHRPELREGYDRSAMEPKLTIAREKTKAEIKKLFDDARERRAHIEAPWNKRLTITCFNVNVQIGNFEREIEQSHRILKSAKLAPVKRQSIAARLSIAKNRLVFVRERAQYCNDIKRSSPKLVKLLESIDSRKTPKTTAQMAEEINWLRVQFNNAKHLVPLSAQTDPTAILAVEPSWQAPSDNILVIWAFNKGNWNKRAAEPFLGSVLVYVFFLVSSKVISLLLHSLIKEEVMWQSPLLDLRVLRNLEDRSDIREKKGLPSPDETQKKDR